jgi:hypothetical protein
MAAIFDLWLVAFNQKIGQDEAQEIDKFLLP